jgi:hypothetical protein
MSAADVRVVDQDATARFAADDNLVLDEPSPLR